MSMPCPRRCVRVEKPECGLTIYTLPIALCSFSQPRQTVLLARWSSAKISGTSWFSRSSSNKFSAGSYGRLCLRVSGQSYEFIFRWKIKRNSSYTVVSGAHVIPCSGLSLYSLLMLTCILLCPASNSCWISGIMYLFKTTNINIFPPNFGLLVCARKTKISQVLRPDSRHASVRPLSHVNIQKICFFEPAWRKGYDCLMHLSSWRWEES